MNELYQSNLKNQRGNQKKQQVKFADQKTIFVNNTLINASENII